MELVHTSHARQGHLEDINRHLLELQGQINIDIDSGQIKQAKGSRTLHIAFSICMNHGGGIDICQLIYERHHFHHSGS